MLLDHLILTLDAQERLPSDLLMLTKTSLWLDF